nr:uncharacterized protein LOC113401324 [Vanessa tameamea]
MLSKTFYRQKSTKVQTLYDNITNDIKCSLKSAQITGNEHNRNKIFSARTLKLLQRRKVLQQIKNKSLSMKNELAALYKLVNKYIKYDYGKYKKDIIERHINLTSSSKKAYKDLKMHKTWIEGLKKTDKEVSNNDIITIAIDFYKNLYSGNTLTKNTLYNSTNTATRLLLCTTTHDSEENIETITESEIIETIQRLKLEKSPGSNNITNEALKAAHEILASPLAHLFNLILQTSETPTQCSESNKILIYKKGDPKDIGNYTPISLLPSMYKLFAAIITQESVL